MLRIISDGKIYTPCKNGKKKCHEMQNFSRNGI